MRVDPVSLFGLNPQTIVIMFSNSSVTGRFSTSELKKFNLKFESVF